MASATQSAGIYHRLSIDSPAKDALLINSFVGAEKLSGLFNFEVELLADIPSGDDQKIKPKSMIGQPVTVTIDFGGTTRLFNGVCSRFWQFKSDDRFAYYRAELVPWLWLLQLQSNCRIFQKMTIPQILKQVFNAFSHPSVLFDDRLNGSYTQIDYCVQYRESDFNFVSRLMEREGIFYWFEHDNGKHTLVMGDDPSAHNPCPGKNTFRFHGGGFGEREECVFAFDSAQQISPGRYTLRDFQFQLDTNNMEVSVGSVVNVGGNQSFEVYDYPGRYAVRFNEPQERLSDVQPEGEKLVKLRMQEEEAIYTEIHGSSDCRPFVAGYTFTLTDHDRDDVNTKYLLTSVQHSAVQVPDYVSGSSAASSYSNSFTCIPFSVPFRPPWVTPKPVVYGPQTAIVVGGSGDEICTDPFGRVKVQFHWDRQGNNDDQSSCWIRVTHPWAGTQWGGIWIPRVGQEVVVNFLDGDPDHPLITGCVYNASHMPPYTLPDHKTVSTLMSRSTTEAASSNFNEIRFEDKIGNEQIFLNAERDMDHRVEVDYREFVGSNRHLNVGTNQTEQIGTDKNLTIGNNHVESVGKNMSLTVGTDLMESIGNDQHLNVTNNYVENIGSNVDSNVGAKVTKSIGADFSLNIVGNRKEAVGGNLDLAVSSNRTESVGGNQSLQITSNSDESIGQNYALTAGQNISVEGQMNIVIQAGMQLTLAGPGGFITIGPSGVAIQGTMVLINSGGSAGSGQSASTQTPQQPDTPKSPKAPDNPTAPQIADDGSAFKELS